MELLSLAVLVGAALALGAAVRWSLVLSRPDEWLLRIRDGKLLAAGVGISVWRRPGDVLARFSSTVQRVKFEAEGLSAERLVVRLEGFVLWSVSKGGDQPLRAFSKLGIANLEQRPPGLRSDKHLLTGAQHKAFQALLGAEIQQAAAGLRLSELLSGPGPLLPAFRARLELIAERLGITMEQVEVVVALPKDPSLLADLSAEEEQRVRGEAARVRLESATRLAREEARAKSEQEASAARAALALEEERARLLEAQEAVWRRKAEADRAHRLAELEAKRAVEARDAELARAAALTKEETETLLQQARLAREALALAERLDRVRREAEAQADATRLITEAEAAKPQAVRDHELSRLVTEKTAAALSALPLKEARWVSVGNDSPAASLRAMVAGVGELLQGAGPAQPR